MFLNQFRRINIKGITYNITATMATRTPDPAKVQLREEIAQRISQLSKEEKDRQSNIVYNKIINHPYYKAANRIAVFMSTDDEVNTAPIISHIQERGASAFVPQYLRGVMRMLKVENGDQDIMPLTRHGIKQHSKDQIREDALDSGLDLIIAPGVAFTLDGGRVGHGAGYYDKYLTKIRAMQEIPPKVIAVAFNCQIVDKVPMNDLDQKIDGVIYAE
ncbi:5-formyltetrahydrofolate cyclo-ligase-like [Colias croceus]|uniref:5-formyltetrahydrofolate cyclo-ligase-like n=1 Tax=Colias crocea TaxID=72248 RepID=UPI001E27BE94|nr:5-formyltetrahydrofolate cyclo-ligase-like [Colias croceus]